MEKLEHILARGDYRNTILTPPAYDEPQPLTWAEKLNVGDMSHTFAAFAPVAGTEMCLKVFREMAEGKLATPFAFCYGGVGNGKTHLLEALVIRLNERRLFTRYYTWAEVVGNLRRFIKQSDPMDPPYEVVLDRWCRSPRLVIDDLGMGTTDTNWELAQLEVIINFRYRISLFTAIATNKDVKELPPRIMSRIMDKGQCTMCLNKAGDFRKTKQPRKTK